MKNKFSKWDVGGGSRSIIQGLNLFASRNLFKSLKSILMVVALLSLSSNVWGADITLAEWNITTKPTSGTAIAKTGGTATGSTCTLTGTMGGIKTKDNVSVVYFTAISTIQISVKAPSAIAKGTVITVNYNASYNKSSNAPWKGVSIMAKEGSSTAGTTGLNPSSLSFSTTVAQKTFTYTVQNDVAKDAIILFTMTQTGKAGAGEGYFNNLSVTMPEPVASYTVNWTINPAAGGTLSATSGTSTTVTPNSAYTYGSPAYTVTSGSATVSQSTNTFTATPSANCTIRINMVEKPKYTVTLKDDNSTLTQASVGASITLPSRAGCTGYTFAGWTKSWTKEQSSWTTTAPTIIPAGSYTPEGNENLYPVYTKEESGSGFSKYEKVTSAPSDWSGQYLLSTGTYTATGAISSSHLTRDTYTSWTTEATSREFTLAKVGDVGYSIKFGSNYLGYSSGTNFSTNPTAPTATSTAYLWTPSTSGINNVGTSARKIADGGNDFRPYSSPSDGIVYLYKRIEGGSTTFYISIPSCGPSTYTVNFAVSPGGYGTVSQESLANVASGTSISADGATLTVGSNTITATPATKTAQYTYTFSNWTWSPTGSTITEATTATANFTRTENSYTVSYVDGGNVDYTNKPTSVKYSDAGLTINASAKSGYSITGVSVTMGGSALTSDDDYTWENGELWIMPTNFTGNIVVTFTTATLTCTQYSFHYGTDGQSDWDQACFSGDGDYRTIENFIIPDKPNYYVGWAGSWQGTSPDNYSEMATFASNLKLTRSLKTNEDAGVELGSAAGAKGTLRVTNSWGCCNKRVAFDPAGYGLCYGAEGGSWSSLAMTSTDGVTYMSEQITLTSDMLTNNNYKYYVGILAPSEGLGYKYAGKSKTSVFKTMGIFFNSTWVSDGQIGNTYTEGAKGRIRMWSDDFNDNWHCHFVPDYNYILKDDNDNVLYTSAYVSCEASDKSTTINNSYNPSKTGYALIGWSRTKGATTADVALGAAYSYWKSNDVLYPVWKEIIYTLDHITVDTYPTKTEYVQGDELNTTGLVLTATYTDNVSGPGKTENISSGFTCSPTTLNTPGASVMITVTYQGKTTTFNVSVTAKYTVTFKNNGETLATDGTRQVPSGQAIGTLPVLTLGDACDYASTTFVGWSATEIMTKTDVKPTLISASTVVSADITYHAVWAEGTTSTFDAATLENLTEDDEYWVWTENTTGVEMGISAGQRYTGGSPYTFTITAGTGNYFYVEHATAKINTLTVTLSGTSYKIGSVSNGTLTTNGTTQTVTGINATQVKCYATNSQQIRATKIVATTATNYITKCATTATIKTYDGSTLLQTLTDQTLDVAVKPTAPLAKTGYDFVGWNEDQEATTGNLTFTPTIAKEYTLYAIWQAHKHTLTYANTEGATIGNGTAAGQVAYGTALTTPTNVTKPGYDFAGWSANLPATMPDNDVTITASWNLHTYTATVDQDGGTGITSMTVTYLDDKLVITGTSTKNEFKLTGYLIGSTPIADKDGNLLPNVSGYTNADGEWIGTSNPTIKVEWTAIVWTDYLTDCSAPDTWTVWADFDGDENWSDYTITDGVVVVSNVAKESIFDFKIRKTNNNTEYTYYGASGDGNRYTTSDEPWTLDHLNENGYNVHVHAGAAGVYTINVTNMTGDAPQITVTYPTAYTITFDGNDADGGSMTNVTNIAAGENVALPTPGFTKIDWNCIGWTADVNVTVDGETVTAGSFIPKTAATIQNINSDITLTAVWEQLVITQVAGIYEVVVNGTLQLTLTAYYSPNITTGATYTWATNDTRYATVDNNGLVTGHQAVNDGEFVTVTSSYGTVSNGYNIVVKSAACDTWGLHYWNTENHTFGDLCFSQVGETNEWRTDQEHLFILPSNSDADKLILLYGGVNSAHAEEWAFRWVPTIASQAGGCGENDGNHYSGQDAIGYFRIFANSEDKNSYLGFQPVYSAAFGRDGEDWQIKDFANTGNANYHGHEYATDINDMIEVPEGYNTDVKLYVGTKNSHGTVNQVYERSNMRLMSNVPELNGTGHAHEFGRLYIHPADACNNADNYDVHFVRFYRLHYDLDGGETAAAYDDQFAWSLADAADRTFTLATAPTKDGFTFRGWSVSIGGGEATTMQPGETVVLTDDAVVTAIWAKNYTVTYDLAGYSTSCSSSTVHYCGEEVTVCPAPEDKTGYTFKGWNTDDITGSPADFEPGYEFIMPCNDVVFTAHYEADSYTITYEGLEGATHTNPTSYTIETPTITLQEPGARTGYEFLGWFDAETDGNKVTGIVSGSTGNVTVWAHWNALQYTVRLDKNDGDADGTATFVYNTSNGMNYTAVTRNGYDLNGYWTTAGGGTQVLDNSGTVTAGSLTGWKTDGKWTKANNDGVLYAHWTAKSGISYTVNHYQMNVDGETYTLKEHIDGTGKTGDDKSSYAQPKTYEGFATPEAQTLILTWPGPCVVNYYYERKKYELTWNFDDGTPAGEYTQGQVYHGATIKYPTSVSKDGYCFKGWDPKPTTMPMAATTIAAQWGAYENYRTYCGNAVTFVANGGTGDDYVVTVDADKLTHIPTVETAGFTREGYGFAGWMVDGDESKAVYAPDATIDPITDGMIVKAVWISNPTINEAVPAITSTNNVAIASAQRTLTVANPDGLEATIHIAYKKNGEAVEKATNSEFRFCNTGGTISEDNIVSSATSIATDFTIQYKPNAYNKIDNDYTLYITVTRKGSATTVSSAEFNLKGRSLPEKFVIAVKNSSDEWLALPANMTDPCTPAGMPITVTGEGLGMTADASVAAAYSLTGHDFAKDSAFFTSAYNSGNLWAAKSTSEINDKTTTISSSNKDNFDWGLTPKDETLISYNMTNKNNGKDLRYWEAAPGGPKFGMYASGVNTIYFIAVTPKEETTAVVDEWYQNKILFHLPFAMKSVSMTINGVAVEDAAITIAERKIKTTGYVLYELGGNIDLVAHSGQVMELTIGDGTTEYVANISIPQIIVSEVASCSALPAKADVVVRDGGHLTIDIVDGVAPKSFNNVTIYPNSKISVPEGKYFNVKSLTFFGGIDEMNGEETNIYAPELSLKGTMKADTLIYRMRVNAEHMMPVSFPYNVTINKIVREDKLDSPSWGKVGTDIRLETYNGELRAAGNRRESDESTWTEIKEGTLTAGIGYTVAAQNRFKSYLYTILDFPMANPYKSAAAEEVAKNADVAAHDAVNWYDKGWNLMGNPYMAGITGAGAIKVNETEYDFVYIPTADGEDYYQGPIATAKILPFKDFFVQVNEGGTMYFDLTKRVDAPARMLADIERTAQFSIGLAGANKTDITYFKVADNFTESYDIPGDNAKMFGSAVNTKVYSLLNGEDQLAQMALNADMTAQPIQLGYIAPENGEYIFALDNTYTDYQNVEHIYLLENGEIKVDLLNAQYTFTTEAKTDNERFAILIVMKGAKMPTDLMDGLFNNDVASPKKVIYNDHFYILNTNRRVYDGTGKYINKMQKNK